MHYQFLQKNNQKLIIFLHGFLGSSNCYNFLLKDIFYDTLIIDLPAHGKSSISRKDSFQKVSIKIFEIINHYSHQKKILVGYSMGGRFCLQLCIDHPNYFSGLILESVGFGIANFFDKITRKNWQKQIIKKTNLLSKFLSFWYSQKLFSSLKNNKEIYSKMIFQKRRKISLKKILIAFENFSPLCHECFYNSLVKIKNQINIVYFAGQKDIKYKNILLKLQKHCKIDGYLFKNVGHNIKLESPTLYKNKLFYFLEKL